ncbi:MAG TPA: M56 family metallopeptidase [Candidatus Eremiobacteraceae bacterium]|nr:M56 family metallopeptidase [Candidatus Eremiobacteraceae bacterium]
MQVWLQLGEAFARVSVGAILNGLWEALAVALLAWLVLRLAPRANASLRYGLWCVALAAVVILPVIALHAGATPPAASGGDSAVAVPQRFAQILFALWYVVATVLVLRLIVSYIRLQQLKAEAHPLSVFYQHRVRRWLAATGGRRTCRLCVSDKVPMPVAIGLFDPVIVLPERLLEQLSDDELDQVGLHELAHLQRWDDYTNVFQRIAEALLFFNPAVHIIGRQLTLEREIACDDRVIAGTGKPLTYAACLTRLVEATALTRQALPALAATSTRRQLAIRIERLLEKKRRAIPFASGFAAVALCAAIAGALVVASRMSPLVSVMPDSTYPAGPAALAHHERGAKVLAIVLVQSRHTAAHAAATAAVRSAAFARHADTVVHRVFSVARSNAVGARNFIFIRHEPAPPLAHQAPPREAAAPPAVVPATVAPVVSTSDTSVAYAAPPDARIVESSADATNADVANAGATDNIPLLAAKLPTLSSSAKIIAIQRLGAHADSIEARAALVDALRNDASLAVKIVAVQALAQSVHEAEQQDALLDALRSSATAINVKLAIIAALTGAVHDDAVSRGIGDAFASQPEEVQIAAVQALSGASYETEAQTALINALANAATARVKMNIIHVLMDDAREPAVRKALQATLSPSQPVGVQLAAVEALAPAADDPEIRAVLERAGGTISCDIVKLSIKRALAEQR